MGKILGVLFCGVFVVAGIGFFVAKSIPMISVWFTAKSWEQVNAQLQSYDLETSDSDDTRTYKVVAKYEYQYLGQYYTSTRVSLSSGFDNIGSYHKDTHKKLKRIGRGQAGLRVWVDPKKPQEAIIDREMRWGLLMFESMFLLLFGGFGLGGIYFIYRNKGHGVLLADADPSKPWTQFSEWNSPVVLSSAKSSSRMLLGFAVIWNLISVPISIVMIEPILQGEYMAAFVFLFPVIGVFILALWYKAHRSYKLTGPMPLTLDPYPASIGGQLGGTIAITNRQANLSKTAEVSIKHVHTYMTGSGDDRETRERVLYEQAMVPVISYGPNGQEMRFCFNLDENQSIAQSPFDMPRKTWRVSFTAVLNDGTNIERDYDNVPVFATGKQSSIQDKQAHAATSSATIEAKTRLVDTVLDLKPDVRGQRLHYPAFRNKTMFLLVLFGLIFVVAGVMIPVLIFNIIFPLIGGAVALFGFYSFANSLDVRVGAEGITSERGLLGFTFKPKFVPSYAFKNFQKESSYSATSGKKTTIFYKIVAYGNEGQKAVVAEGLKGTAEADAAIEKLMSLMLSR